MEINFDEVDTTKSFQVYPKGVYTVRIKSIEEVQASTGNNQLRIKTDIITPDDYNGKPLTDHITLVPSCDWKLGKFVAGCGIDIKALGKMDTSSGGFRALLNKLINKTTVWVLTEEADRNGNPRNGIVDYQPDENASDNLEDTPDFLAEPQGTQSPEKWPEEEEK